MGMIKKIKNYVAMKYPPGDTPFLPVVIGKKLTNRRQQIMTKLNLVNKNNQVKRFQTRRGKLYFNIKL